MAKKRLALFFLLIFAMELMFCAVDASPWFWRRRRRRRAAPPPPPPPPPPTTPTPKPTPKPCNSSIPNSIKWANKWHQSFYAHCPNGEVLDHILRSDCEEGKFRRYSRKAILRLEIDLERELYCEKKREGWFACSLLAIAKIKRLFVCVCYAKNHA